MTDLEQIEKQLVVTTDGNHAIDINPQSRTTGWAFYKHVDGQFVTLRCALPMEILNAKKHLEELEVKAGIPCKV